MGITSSRGQEDPVFIIPRNIYFTPSQMSSMIEAGQQPGVPFRVGGEGAQRPSRALTKALIIHNPACIDKNSFTITINESGKFSVSFIYDSVVPLSLYIHFGARDSSSSQEIRPKETLLHWGPFNLPRGMKCQWSSVDENLFGNTACLPCSSGGLVDAIVVLDSSSGLPSPRFEGTSESRSSREWGRFLSISNGAKTSRQKTDTGEAVEYSITQNNEIPKSLQHVSKHASYFLVKRNNAVLPNDNRTNSSDSSGQTQAPPPNKHRKHRHKNSNSERVRPTSAPSSSGVDPEYRGKLAVQCVLQKVQMQSGGVFIVQDLYGMDRNDPEERDTAVEVDTDAPECVICMTDPKEVAVYPCRHMCMCLTCAEALPSQGNKCPMCRRSATMLLRLQAWGGPSSTSRQDNSSPSDENIRGNGTATSVSEAAGKERTELELSRSLVPSRSSDSEHAQL
mmetsp:Transcript_9487/g.14286  ORF Transcript_9487/g.14286 Transcript_9487/m.14286 type:complete len:451 (-) Transcript_9487:279-1631(-)